MQVIRIQPAVVGLAFAASMMAVLHMHAAQPNPIPGAAITALDQELKLSVGSGKSAVTVRRACKRVVREAEELLDGSPPMAPNRFALVQVLFQAQQRLLSLEMTDQNRTALFKTCEALAKAPDEYAESRLQADLLLSERDLGAADALVTERVGSLRDIIRKYRGTSAELHSLTIAALIAAKLQAFDFQEEIHDKLKGRAFGADHEAIAFRRKSHAVSSLNALFGGTYESVGGPSFTFPFDRLGHQYLVIFWSLNSDGLEGHERFLGRVREQQERFPGRFEVYSFNLDSLPDAGNSILAKAGVNATALRLPEGRASSAYRAYALTDPMAMFVNAQGHTTLRTGQIAPWPRPSPARGKTPANPGPGLGKWLDDERYLAQLRSLLIGDFLVAGQLNIEHPDASLKRIRECFVDAPLRYRLTAEEELENYRKAEALCAGMIEQTPGGADQWRLRNARIIALLGMWKLGRDPSRLAEAVKAAEAVLAMDPPAEWQIIPNVCLAKAALRGGRTDTEAVLKTLAKAGGGESVPAVAYAAAAIVAIEANAEELYREYRGRFLAASDENGPSLWPVVSFLRDRHHDYRLFWPTPGRWGYTRKQRYKVRQLIAGFGAPAASNSVLAVQLKQLDGQELAIPRNTNGKMLGTIFVEPPEDDSERDACATRLKSFADQFSDRNVPVVVAFLSEDANAAKSVLADWGGSFRAAIVLDALENPLVRRFGILSADRMPNPFLLRADGTIAWWSSGLTYPVEHTRMQDATAAAIGIRIEKERTDHAFEPLTQGDFKKALLLLSERLPPKMGRDAWTPDRLQGRALAHMGLKNWDAALAEIDAAIAELMGASRHGGRVHRGSIEMLHVRAAVLAKLGRATEAGSVRAQAEKEEVWLKTAPYFHPPSFARNGIPVGVYTELLKRVRLGLEER